MEHIIFIKDIAVIPTSLTEGIKERVEGEGDETAWVNNTSLDHGNGREDIKR